MIKLYQKNHGLPGIGIKANNGKTGVSGNSIYFGFINEFFDNDYISIDTSVRDAVRRKKYNNSTLYYSGVFNNENIDVDFKDSSHFDFIYNIKNYQNLYDYNTEKTIAGKYISNIFVNVNLNHIGEDYSKNIPNDTEGIGVDLTYYDINFPNQYNFYNKNKYLSLEDIKKNPIENNEILAHSYIRTATTELSDSSILWKDETGNIYYYDSNATIQEYNNIRNNFNKEFANAALNNSDVSILGVKWIKENILEIAVPTTLKSSIKEGDILYFYTDTNQFNIDRKLNYMVVITKELENASYDKLMQNITLINPFDFSNFKTINSSILYTDKKINFTNYEIDNTISKNIKEIFVKNFNNTLNNNSLVNITELDEDNNTDFLSLINSKEINRNFNISYNNDLGYSISVNNDNGNSNSDKTLKFSNLYLNNNSIVNSELINVVNPSDIIFDNNFIYSFSDNDFDDNKIGFNIDINKFLNNIEDLEDWQFGAIIFDNSTNILEDKIAKNYFIQIDYNEKINYQSFTIIPYIQKIGITKYYGKGSILNLYIEDTKVISRSIEENIFYDESSIIENNEEIINYNQSYISADKSENNILTINLSDSSYFIKNIFINNENINNDISNNWFKKENIIYDSSLSATIIFSVDENIPNLYNTKDNNIIDISTFIHTVNNNIISNIVNKKTVSSESRKILVTTQYANKEYPNIILKSNYWIIQPGFEDPRVLPNIFLIPKISQIELEKSNDIDNGILSNQFQYFIDISIDNFDNNTWGKYAINDPTLNITFKTLSDDIELINYGFSPYSPRPTIKCILDNEENYISMMSNITIANIDSSIETIKNNIVESVIDSSYAYYDIENDEYNYLSNIDEKIIIDNNTKQYFNNPELRSSGINKFYNITLKNLKISDIQNNNYKIRVLFEFGNPVPSEIYLNWVVDNIEINLDNKIFKFNNLTTEKRLNTQIYHEYIFSSQPTEFIINPISLIAAPNTEETLLSNIKGTIKLTGSTDNIKIKSEMYKNSLDEIIENYTLDNNTISAEEINWKPFNVKTNYLQDNIKYISIYGINPFDIFALDSSLNNLYNFTNYSEYSRFDDNAYLSIIYNANIMRAKNYNDNYQFYYNDLLYDAEKYNQFGNNAPGFVNVDTNIQVRSDALIKAMETWNYEYEYQTNKIYEEKTYEGFISKYGNGYMYLDASVDENQYQSDNILSLLETKELNNTSILNNKIISQISNNSYEYLPDDNNFFRTLLYDLKWQYPLFISNKEFNSYNIVSAYDKLINNTENSIQSNILFSVYPRILQNTNYNCINILMLRCPSIEKENNLKLNIHYFDLIDGQKIQELNNPHTLK